MPQLLKTKDLNTKQQKEKKKDDEKDKSLPVDFLVHFSLAVDKPEDFKNEFGFDYMRPEYENIIQTDYEDLKTEYCIFNNVEPYVLGKPYYTPWLAMFKDHKKITGYEVKLKLHTQKLEETPNDEIDTIQFACPAGIEIYDEGGNTKIEKLKYSEIEGKVIQIKCTQSFSEHQYITIVHAETKHSLGFLNLYKNNPTYRLNVKFVKVKFKGKVTFGKKTVEGKTYTGYTDFSNDKYAVNEIDEKGAIVGENPFADSELYLLKTSKNLNDMVDYIKDNIKNTKKYLAQALIQLNVQSKVEEIKISLGDYNKQNSSSSGDLSSIRKIKESIVGQYGNDLICNYDDLLSGLREYYSYEKQMQIEPGVIMFISPVNIILGFDDLGKPIILDGFTEVGKSKARFCMFPKTTDIPQKLPSIVAHEIAHSLGLMHSFQSEKEKDLDGSINPSKHRFARGTTDNLMDYTPEGLTFDQLTVKDKKKDMLWKWQWDVMQQDAQDLSTIQE